MLQWRVMFSGWSGTGRFRQHQGQYLSKAAIAFVAFAYMPLSPVGDGLAPGGVVAGYEANGLVGVLDIGRVVPEVVMFEVADKVVVEVVVEVVDEVVNEVVNEVVKVG